MPTATRIVNPQYLVETEWLAAHLADPELRVFDCTTYLDPDPLRPAAPHQEHVDLGAGAYPGAGPVRALKRIESGVRHRQTDSVAGYMPTAGARGVRMQNPANYCPPLASSFTQNLVKPRSS